MDISFAFRKIQKSIAGLSILAVLTSLVSFTGIASADTFPDVDSDHYAYDAVDEASDEGWMTGYDNGNFGVDDTLTRAQAAKILVLGALGEDAVDEDYDAGFSDVSDSDSLEDYVNTAELYGFVSGYTDADGDLTGVYGYNDPVNRAQFAKMAVDAFGLESVDEALDQFPDVSEGIWYEMSDTWYVSTAWSWSVVNGYENGNYYPSYDVTRGQAAIMVNNAQEPEWREPGSADDDDDDDDDVEAGTLWVEVSDDTAEAMTIPSNATSVEIASWDFTADGVELDSLTIHQSGITSLSSTHQVYLYNGTERLTSGTSVNTTTYEATFNNLNLEIDGTVTLTARMDMGDYTSTGEVGFEIVSASKVDAGDADVSGSFPAEGEMHTISTTDAGTVTIEKNGTVENAEVGEDGATVAKFKLSTATEAGGVEEIGLYLSGSISTADVENFNLYVSGDDAEPLATAEAVDGQDVLRFDISGDFDNDSSDCENSDGYCISKGSSKSFYVTADFNTGRTGDTVEIYLDQSTDLFVRGALYGAGMSVTRTNYDGNANACSASTDADCSYFSLEGGDVTISSNGPAATDVATGADDVAVLDFTIASVTEVTFDSFEISMDTSSDATDATEGLLSAAGVANFTDVKIWDVTNDEALFAGVDATSFKTATGGATAITETEDASASYYLFTDDFSMESGEEREFSLTTDIANVTTLTGMTFTANLELGNTYPQLKDVNNKALTNSGVLVPTSAITSKTMTVRTPSLEISLASTPTSGANTYVKGSDDVPFVGFAFACGDSSDCKVTNLTLSGLFDDDQDLSWETSSTSTVDGADAGQNMTSVIGSVALEDEDGEQVAAAKGVNNTTWAVTYDSLSWTIPAGETEVIYVVGDLSTNAGSENVTFRLTASNVTVEDEDGSTFSATVGGSTSGISNDAVTYVSATTGGSLTVAVASGTARENIAIAGSMDVEVSSFEFISTREAFVVTDLAINNRQSGIVATSLGDYDNNVVSLTISYENEDGTTVEDTAPLVSGTANFSGLELYVPADDTASMTVYADLNSIASSGSSATAGEFVDLSMTFNNFEAVAEGSGETYKGEELDANVAADADLDFGTITYTDGDESFDVDGAAGADNSAALGATASLVIDSNATGDNTNKLPVGTVLCVDDDDSATCATEDIYIVTAWPSTTSGTEDTVTAMLVDDAGDQDYDDNDPLLYSLPGTGFLTGTNQMVVYESKPTLALASTTPSGSRSVSAADDAFAFSISADDEEKVQVRTAVDYTTCVAGTGATVVNAAQTTATVDGSSCELTDLLANTDSVLFANSANLANFTYVSFWFRWNDDSANAALPVGAISVATADANDGVEDQVRALTSANVAGGVTTFAEGNWYLVKDVVMPSGTDVNDTVIGLQFTDATNVMDQDADDVFIDQFRVYNEKIEVDVASDADFDRTFNQGSSCATAGNTGCPVVAYLKESGNTIATGYVDSVAVDANADGAEDATDGSSAVILFVPTTAQGTLEVAAGSSKTYTVTLSTTNLLGDESGVDDPVTFSIDYGSSSNGTVTAGDFWWYETNATVRWLGQVANTSLVSNTVKY